MNIYEATKQAVEQDGYITRQKWGDRRAYIEPTDTPFCCILFSLIVKDPRARWKPAAEDLLAEDWFVKA